MQLGFAQICCRQTRGFLHRRFVCFFFSYFFLLLPRLPKKNIYVLEVFWIFERHSWDHCNTNCRRRRADSLETCNYGEKVMSSRVVLYLVGHGYRSNIVWLKKDTEYGFLYTLCLALMRYEAHKVHTMPKNWYLRLQESHQVEERALPLLWVVEVHPFHRPEWQNLCPVWLWSCDLLLKEWTNQSSRSVVFSIIIWYSYDIILPSIAQCHGTKHDGRSYSIIYCIACWQQRTRWPKFGDQKTKHH